MKGLKALEGNQWELQLLSQGKDHNTLPFSQRSSEIPSPGMSPSRNRPPDSRDRHWRPAALKPEANILEEAGKCREVSPKICIPSPLEKSDNYCVLHIQGKTPRTLAESTSWEVNELSSYCSNCLVLRKEETESRNAAALASNPGLQLRPQKEWDKIQTSTLKSDIKLWKNQGSPLVLYHLDTEKKHFQEESL